jgi:hypothetical protein
MAIARQRLAKRVSWATNTHAAIEPLEEMFSMQSMLMLYKETQLRL